MFPIRAGMRLRQPAVPGRVFRVTGEPTGEGEDALWPLELVEAVASDTRQPGFATAATEEWLFRHTEPHTPGVPAPCGDGVQVVRHDGTLSTFTTAEAAVTFAVGLVNDDHDVVVEWYGWPITADAADTTPDLVVLWSNDEDSAIWMEPVG